MDVEFVFVHRALTIFIMPAVSPRQQPITACNFTGSNLCHIISFFKQQFYLKVYITSMGILNVNNLWILFRESFSLLNWTEVTWNRESLYMKTSSQIPDLPSLPSTLTAKKSMKTTFSSGKIYYNFSEENPKITDI